MRKRTAGYIRVSTQEQKLHGISLDAQKSKLEEYAKAHALDIVEWYADEGISGKKPISKRPALQRMIADAEQGLFEHIIFIKLDRFFRSVAEYHECMKRLGAVTWDATEEKYDISTANGRAFVNMKLTIAELEADQTGERIKLVNEYKVKTGQPLHGSMPWSHKIVQTENGKRVIVNPDTRDGCLEVLEYFESTGLLRQTLFYARQFHDFYDLRGLKRWLTNTMLYGSYKGNDAYCEALITKERFDRVQTLLRTSPRSSKRTYKFSGLLKCPVCGKRLVGCYIREQHNGKRYEYNRYKCDYYANKRGCSYSTQLSENMVEKTLLAQLEDFIEIEPSPKFRLADEKKRHDPNKIKAELERLNYMFQKNRISVEDYDKEYSALHAKLQEKYDDSADQAKLEELQTLLDKGFYTAYQALDDKHRQIFWHSVLRGIEIEKDGRHYTITGLDFIEYGKKSRLKMCHPK